MNYTAENLKERNKTLNGYEAFKAKLEDVAKCLSQWDKKNINKKFFEHFFIMKDEDGKVRNDWKGNVLTHYTIRKSGYSFEAGTLELVGFGPYQLVKLSDRSTEKALEAVNQKIENVTAWIAHEKQQIAELSRFDEEQFVADMRAVYVKYGKPDNWTSLLDIYEVKYPRA